MILLVTSLACNLWFAFLLLYDRIMETKFVRFIIGITEVWKSLRTDSKNLGTENNSPAAEPEDVMGKSLFRMYPTQTMTDIPAQEAATSEKGDEVSENDVTFAEERTETESKGEVQSRQVPADQLDDVFSSIPLSELRYSEEDNEQEDSRTASGNSFDEIADAIDIVRKVNPTDKEKRNAGKILTELDGTELFDKIISDISDEAMSDRIFDAIALYVDNAGKDDSQSPKDFSLPDDIRNFDASQFYNN